MTSKIKEIEFALQENFEAGVDLVWRGKKKKWNGSFVSPQLAALWLQNMGFNYYDDYEYNGWQYDWWMIFEKGNRKFTMFGCGYNGECEFSNYAE